MANTNEREFFDTIGKRYIQKDIYMPSRLARQHRLRQTVNLVVEKRRNLSILEIGCGAGFSATYLQGTYSRYVGVDYSRRLIDFANQKNSFKDVEFICADLMDLTALGLFDVILMIGVLHHVERPREAILQLSKYLNSNGVIIANEPSKTNVAIRILRKFRKRMDKDYSPNQREYSADELSSLFAECGLVDLHVRPQGLLSTPLAEVLIKPQWLMVPISKIACSIDEWLEERWSELLKPLVWNIVVSGRIATSRENKSTV